ncbi:unnamed protein product [Periconia digitata]|uniref:Uncharacterized protein n=1 Tax=Periconia digitata TaxID=1303443 RepID=A0A9W4XI71_9PLEO|nr:unnamed protein product [Periconia digitata]
MKSINATWIRSTIESIENNKIATCFQAVLSFLTGDLRILEVHLHEPQNVNITVYFLQSF